MSQRRRLRRPSPAMVIACTALMLALGGGAYAASQIETRDITPGAVTSPKLAKNAVKTGKIADGAVSGEKISPSFVIDQANTANPRAWAYVSASGTPSSNSNLPSLDSPFPTVSKPAGTTGIYCFSLTQVTATSEGAGVPIEVYGGQVTPEADGSPGDTGSLLVLPLSEHCSTSYNVAEVHMADSSGALTDMGFFVEFYIPSLFNE